MRYELAGEGWQRDYRVRHDANTGEWRITGVDGVVHTMRVEKIDGGVLRLELGAETHSLTLLPGNQPGAPLRLLFDDHYFEMDVRDELDLLEREFGRKACAGGPQELRSIIPGIIKRLAVKEGDAVCAGQSILILEAMKMENDVLANVDGVVVRLHVTEGTVVATGVTLAVIRPHTE
ncbi:MAG: acetyl-CoA carboxylase biotin carboxyl carrier protein subunit [Planctomycetota bacterium]